MVPTHSPKNQDPCYKTILELSPWAAARRGNGDNALTFLLLVSKGFEMDISVTASSRNMAVSLLQLQGYICSIC